MDHARGIWTYFVQCSLSMVFRFEFKIVAYQCNFNRICLLTKRMRNSWSFQSFLWWPGRDMLAISLIGLRSIRSFSIKSDPPNHENSCFGSYGIQRMKLSDSVFLSHLSFLKVAVVLNSRKLLFWLWLASLKSAIMSLPLLNRSSIKLVLLLQCRYSLSSCTWWTCKVYVRHILYMPTPWEYCFSSEF